MSWAKLKGVTAFGPPKTGGTVPKPDVTVPKPDVTVPKVKRWLVYSRN